MTYQRNRKRRPVASDIENFKFADSSQEGIINANKKEAKIELLYHCINQLKKDDRAIILLSLEGNKYEEIADITGLTTSHVGVKIKRIKDRLQKLLKENHYGRI